MYRMFSKSPGSVPESVSCLAQRSQARDALATCHLISPAVAWLLWGKVSQWMEKVLKRGSEGSLGTSLIQLVRVIPLSCVDEKGRLKKANW